MGHQEKKKIIIDTDPGIDDAMAIFVALNSPEVEVIGLTTIYGNVYTTLATRNALHLLEAAERTDIPVAEGSHVTITKGTKLRIADFVHGADGLGNQNFPPPKGKPIDLSASSFLVEQANLYPGKVTVVALGPLTNIALAIELDPTFSKKIGQIVLLGGAFSVNGNVNPAAEANIFGDPDAADIVFTSGADILAVGINVTHQVVLTDAHRNQLAHSRGKFAQYLCKILGIYYSYHNDAYATNGVYLHDPTALLAAVNPSLLTYTEGIVRVQTSGITRGLTLFDNTKKRLQGMQAGVVCILPELLAVWMVNTAAYVLGMVVGVTEGCVVTVNNGVVGRLKDTVPRIPPDDVPLANPRLFLFQKAHSICCTNT